ncbi:hypothetical protein [Sinorhizobium meliloti]|uniref:hypothetical protein n=1 Tax=Rhizobium meliloti TaxID=382 RepID=UPI0013E2C9A7|nr:hypothetical protein [Sinorhizobium meliloti]
MPSGFKSMDDGGQAAYENAYKFRAIVPELLAPSVAAMIGIIHAKETQITVPDGLSSIWENADGEGMSLETFHRRITRYLLWLGRYGVLTTAPAEGGEPFLAGYAGDRIINWDRDFFVMDEGGFRRVASNGRMLRSSACWSSSTSSTFRQSTRAKIWAPLRRRSPLPSAGSVSIRALLCRERPGRGAGC